ncbi:Ca-activated chloride channel family protein [Spirosomataceae bacterium TFI 002]|nr:Ca-activated chloride channel family protein [Spirosomataceae bacterium TFI 002]
MIWSNEISTLEIILIAIFAISYLYYLIKVKYLAKKLELSMRATSLKLILRTLYFGLIIGAILGPSFGITEMEARTAGKDIYLCVDLSQSMNASDVSPSRIEKAKTELIKLVDGIKENRIGIIIFSEQAFIQIPLTFDTEVIKIAISKLNTKLLDENGTNLSAALALAGEKLTEEGNAKERNKVAVFFTDGEDFGEVKTIVPKIKAMGLHSIFVGIGTKAGGEVYDENGQNLKDNLGNNVISRPNFTGLINIATNLNGLFFELNDAADPLKNLSSAIEQFKSVSQSERTVVVANNKYLYFLIPALLLVLIDAIFVVKIFKL